MTRSGLIKRLVAANPQLYARDIERIVGTVFEQIGRERLIAACVEDEVAAWGCGRAARGEPLSEAQHQKSGPSSRNRPKRHSRVRKEREIDRSVPCLRSPARVTFGTFHRSATFDLSVSITAALRFFSCAAAAANLLVHHRVDFPPLAVPA